MKERYFTAESLVLKAEQMRQDIRGLQSQPRVRFNPAHSALLVLDMQGFFLDAASHAYIPSAEAIVHGLQALIRAFSRKKLPIVFTQHVNTPQNARAMADWWLDLVRQEDPLSQIIPAMDQSAGVVIQKSQYDAFFQTELEALLRRRRVEQVVVGGVMTHLCCETTARSAFVRGFGVFFLVDGTATYTEQFHRATLLNIAHGFGWPALVSEILQELGYDAG